MNSSLLFIISLIIFQDIPASYSSLYFRISLYPSSYYVGYFHSLVVNFMIPMVHFSHPQYCLMKSNVAAAAAVIDGERGGIID